jgi:hypothetical protein
MVGRFEILLVALALTVFACEPPMRDGTGTSTVPSDGGAKDLGAAERRIAHQARAYGSRPSPPCPPFPEQAVLGRTYVNEELDAMGPPSMCTWLPVPHFIDGFGFGTKFVGFRPESFFGQLGLCSGDILFDSEGELIGSALDAQAAFERLRTESSVDFTILRRGVWGQLTVFVVDP